MQISSKLSAVAGIQLLLWVSLVGCTRTPSGTDASATANIKGPEKEVADVSQVSAEKKAPVDSAHPVVVLETTLGKVTLKLNAEKAPLTVRNFLSYVNASYYDQTIVHQVFRNHGVVAGGYGANLAQKPAHMAILNEANNGLKNVGGSIAMARLPDAIDSATSQFFINVTDNPNLDFRDRTPDGYGYCVFGEVTEGMDVVNKIAAVEVHNSGDFEQTPVNPIIITSARQIR